MPGPMTSGPMGAGPTGAGPIGTGPMATGPMGTGPVGPRAPLLQINPGQDRMGGSMRPLVPSLMGPGPGGPMNMGPRSNQQMRFPQRGPAPNHFGNSNFAGQRAPRPLFNSNFNNPRFGGPRGSGFNNRW